MNCGSLNEATSLQKQPRQVWDPGLSASVSTASRVRQPRIMPARARLPMILRSRAFYAISCALLMFLILKK